MTGATSVPMAETAAIALAEIIADRLSLHQMNFLSDNIQLVQLLNALNQDDPLDWRIKHFTHLFSNYNNQREKIFKIQKSHQTSDILARQAFLDSQHMPLAPSSAISFLACGDLSLMTGVDNQNCPFCEFVKIWN